VNRLLSILGFIVTAALLSVGVAAAASLGVTTGQLSASHVPVSGCTGSALTSTRNVDNSGNVTQLNVTNMPQACAGEVLAATLKSAANASLGSATAIVGTCTGGCTVTLTGFGTVSAANVTGYALSLTQ
jgi:hypothetical protein